MDLDRPAPAVARDLLGQLFVSGPCVGRIVEVEAYERFDDGASHAANGPTERTQVMFGPAGHLYTYFIYGRYWCANVVTGPADHGAAVLIRALEPLAGLELMAHRRGRGANDPRALCSGPGKLCQALGVDGSHNGIDLFGADRAGRDHAGAVARGNPGEPDAVRIEPGEPVLDADVSVGPRIGISKSVDLPWRFGDRRSPHLSRPFR